jgi:hypothetical protein
MPEESHQENNIQKYGTQSEDPGKKEKKECLTNKLIFIVCCFILGFVGINFISCNFMLPGTMERAQALGGLKNPPPLNCKESQSKGYDVLIAVLSTVIALKAKVD